MRTDEEGIMHTLEEDIIDIWNKHGWEVETERVIGNVWEIKAKYGKSENKLNPAKDEMSTL